MSTYDEHHKRNGLELNIVPLPSSGPPAHGQQPPAAASPADGRWRDADSQLAARPAAGSEAIPVGKYAGQAAAFQHSGVRPASRRDYEVYELIFRNHHATNTARHRGPYEHYRLVYRYGYELGTDARYASAEWANIEQDARPRWEERNAGTWDQFKDLIQYAWNTSRIWQRD